MTEDNRYTIENDRIRISVLPNFGARVVELIDKRTNQNWLVTGKSIGSTSDEAIFGKDQAVGWDECFPTIAASDLTGCERDHGSLWGRPQNCAVRGNEIVTKFVASGCNLNRTLKLHGESLVVEYSLRPTRGSVPKPALWSQHCLIAVAPGDQIKISGLADPEPMLLQEIAPLFVLDSNAGLAQKTYSKVLDDPRVEITSASGKISLSWCSDEIPFCGIWINYGGWPENAPCHQIAFEPATETGEHPSKNTDILGGNIERRWTVKMTVSEG